MADDIMVREGRCLCGAVSYRVAGQPLRVGLCHCQDCRQTSGSAFTLFAVWPRTAWDGQGALTTYKGRSFCPNCGSRVANLTDDEAELMVGTLDQPPSDLLPQYELWVVRREAWLHALPWADQFKGDRTSEGDWRQPVIDP